MSETETSTEKRIPPIESSKAEGALTGARYLESLRDDREIWYRGERIADVTTHPELQEMAQSLARIYDMQHAPETRDVMTYEQENGLRASYSYFPPTRPQDLLLRRQNTAVWVREVFGMCGRLPDFCASMVVGYYDIRAQLAQLDPAAREKHRDLSELRARPRFVPLARAPRSLHGQIAPALRRPGSMRPRREGA